MIVRIFSIFADSKSCDAYKNNSYIKTVYTSLVYVRVSISVANKHLTRCDEAGASVF